MDETLKLYVWDCVLCEWMPVTIYVLAHTLEEAHAKIDEKYGVSEALREVKGSPYQVITEPEAFVVYCGG